MQEAEAEKEFEEILKGSDDQKEGLGSLMEIVEEEEEEDMETEEEDSGCVISDQPVGHGDRPLRPTPALPPSSLPGLVVPCCRGQPESPSPEEGNDEETEPNNNKAPPLLPDPSDPSIPASSPRLILSDKEAQKQERTEEGGREDLLTDRSPPREEAAPRVEQGKRHSLKLRERLFQFPLCEKALAFNIPTQNKPKILPLAQYNCCHVL